MKTIIMAGGRGTRIAAVASDIPKPMIKVNGKPVLEHEIACLKTQGFTELIITVGYLGQMIMEYFGDGSKFGVNIRYFVEKSPLGNAGALFMLREQLTEDFLLLNADAVFDVDFQRMVDFHRKKGGWVTLFTHPNSHPYDSGLLLADSNSSVLAWLAREDERPTYYKNRVNAGLHVVSPAALHAAAVKPEHIGKVDPRTGKIIKVDLDRQVLKPLAGTGKMFCYDSPEYVRDMGTPERYYAVEADFRTGRVQAGNLRNRQKAVFLDRDGTINKYVGFLRREEEFELLPGVAEAVKKINHSGYLCIVVTNQPVIARGEVTVEGLTKIHNKMETLLGNEGAYIDGLYSGYDGEVKELKCDCDCRKPKPGMLLQAAEDFNIDLQQSWMVGDGENDIKAGIAAGCRTALIGSGEFGQTVAVRGMREFVERWL